MQVGRSKTHNVHQFCLGVWSKYSSVPFLSRQSRPKNPTAVEAVENLRREYDQGTRRIMRRLLDIDEETAVSMKYGHRATAAVLRKIKADFDQQQLADKPHESFRLTANAIDRYKEGLPNTAVRFGGAGTVLAISRGEVDQYHVDAGDTRRLPSIVFCTKPAILHVIIGKAEIKVHLAPGDAVGFVAGQYLHKLVRDPDDDSPGELYIFTAWTESRVAKHVQEHGLKNMFYL